MSGTVLNVRVDENLKKDFDDFCVSVGMSSGVVVNMFMRAVTRERRIPFAITDAGEPDDLSYRQKMAVAEFIRSVNAITDEPLDAEFDEILSQRVNISRELDL
jgi:addiction module RelB/DinJ family antitoxin